MTSHTLIVDQRRQRKFPLGQPSNPYSWQGSQQEGAAAPIAVKAKPYGWPPNYFPLPSAFLANQNPMTHSFAVCGHGAIERLHGAASKSKRRNTMSTNTQVKSTEAGKPPVAKLRPPGLLELEELFSQHLDTTVKVTMGPRRGKVQIDFADLEDLERLYRVITQGPTTSD